jgi:DNA replication protein DnaC
MQFEQTIYIRADGSEVPPDARCNRCSRVEELRLKHEAHQRELREADALQRQAWRAALGRELDSKFRGAGFDGFERAKQPAAYRAVTDWPGTGGSLILQSPPGIYGIGKTHLVAALANQLVDTLNAAVSINGYVVAQPRPVAFCAEPGLMARIRATFNEGARESDETIYDQLERVRLLIIDDVGKDPPRDLSFVQRVWYRLIDARYRSERPVILTTNLTLDEFGEHIGGAVADRLREMCGRKGIITMTGESHRRAK